MQCTQEFRFGVLGYGKIARTRFIPALQRIPSTAFCAVGTREPGRLSREAFSPSSPRIMTYGALVQAGRDLIDGVYVSLPNDLHEEWMLRSLDAGLNVLCEKPMTPSHEAATRCRNLARDRDVLLAEAFMYRLDPRHSHVKQLLEAGEIGEVGLLEACFSYCLKDPDNIRLQSERLGGALMDVGCYGLDVARFLLGQEPLDVTAVGVHGNNSRVDELTTAVYSFPGDVVAVVSASTRLHRHNSYRVSGTHGAVVVPKAFIPRPSESTQVIVERAEGERQSFEFAAIDAFELEIRHFAEAARANDAARLPPLEDGVANSRCLGLAVRSLRRSGRRVAG